MKRLQCIGKLSGVSSKDTEKETAPIKPQCATPSDPLPKESVEWKPKQQKPKPSGKAEVQDPTNSVTTNPTTFGAQSTKRQQKPKPQKTERQDPSTNAGTANHTLTTQNNASGGHNTPKAPSFKNVTTHGHKVPKQVVRVMTEQQATSEVHLGCRHELQTLSESDPNPPVEQREEEESEENETAEGHVPLELFAEFLDAVMTKNYQLAKKLCQMILIFEPQNSEAKSFLPLIEEKLLIESSDNDNDESDESDTSDEEEEGDSSDDEDTDDNESSDSCDTDEESTDSTDDTSSSSS